MIDCTLFQKTVIKDHVMSKKWRLSRKLQKFSQSLLCLRSILHHLRPDSCQFRNPCINPAMRIYKCLKRVPQLSVHQTHRTNLQDPVCFNLQSGHLQIHRNQFSDRFHVVSPSISASLISVNAASFVNGSRTS